MQFVSNFFVAAYGDIFRNLKTGSYHLFLSRFSSKSIHSLRFRAISPENQLLMGAVAHKHHINLALSDTSVLFVFEKENTCVYPEAIKTTKPPEYQTVLCLKVTQLVLERISIFYT